MPCIRAAAAAEDGHPCLQKFRHQGREFLRRAVIYRLAVHDLGHPGVGLGDQRHPCIFPQPLQLRQHLPGPGGAVEAESVDAHALEHRQRRCNVRSGDAAAIFIAGKSDQYGLFADITHSQHRCPGIGQGHHGLDDIQVYPGLLQACRLIRINVHQLLKGRLAHGRQKQPGGGEIPGYQGPALCRLFREFRQAAVIVRSFVEDPVLLQLLAVGTKAGAVEHLAPGLHIPALDIRNGLRVGQHPLLGTYVAGKAPFLQLGARSAVQDQGELNLHNASSVSLIIHRRAPDRAWKRVPLFSDLPAQVFTPGKCGILDTSNYHYYTVLYCS